MRNPQSRAVILVVDDDARLRALLQRLTKNIVGDEALFRQVLHFAREPNP